MKEKDPQKQIPTMIAVEDSNLQLGESTDRTGGFTLINGNILESGPPLPLRLNFSPLLLGSGVFIMSSDFGTGLSEIKSDK